MGIRDNESQKIIGAAQRYIKTNDRSDLESFSLELLTKANYQLGNRDINSGYRKALSDRIEELKCTNKPNDIIDIKPNFYGIGFNLNEVLRRLKSLFAK